MSLSSKVPKSSIFPEAVSVSVKFEIVMVDPGCRSTFVTNETVKSLYSGTVVLLIWEVCAMEALVILALKAQDL